MNYMHTSINLLLFFNFKIQLMKWCHLHSGHIFPTQKTQIRKYMLAHTFTVSTQEASRQIPVNTRLAWSVMLVPGQI